MNFYFFRSLLHLIIILFGVSLISFALMHIGTIDTVDLLYSQYGGTTEELLTAKRIALGLNEPVVTQYIHWISQICSGDFGTSFVSGRPVSEILAAKIPGTALLMLTSTALSVGFSLPLGIISAVKKDRFPDYGCRIFSFIGTALPDFCIGLLILYCLVAQGSGKELFSPSLPILPTLTLSVVISAKYTRQIRALFLEELNKSYVKAALARGIPPRFIWIHYILPALTAPLLTILALSVGSLLGGTAVVETIFRWDGLGRAAVEAISLRDYPIIQAYVLWSTLVYVSTNFLADMLGRKINPGRADAREKEVLS